MSTRSNNLLLEWVLQCQMGSSINLQCNSNMCLLKTTVSSTVPLQLVVPASSVEAQTWASLTANTVAILIIGYNKVRRTSWQVTREMVLPNHKCHSRHKQTPEGDLRRSKMGELTHRVDLEREGHKLWQRMWLGTQVSHRG